MPVYYVISEDMRHPGVWYELNQILFVVACRLSDTDEIWARSCAPLVHAGRNIRAHIYLREEANPFKELAKDEHSISL